ETINPSNGLSIVRIFKEELSISVYFQYSSSKDMRNPMRLSKTLVSSLPTSTKILLGFFKPNEIPFRIISADRKLSIKSSSNTLEPLLSKLSLNILILSLEYCKLLLWFFLSLPSNQKFVVADSAYTALSLISITHSPSSSLSIKNVGLWGMYTPEV